MNEEMQREREQGIHHIPLHQSFLDIDGEITVTIAPKNLPFSLGGATRKVEIQFSGTNPRTAQSMEMGGSTALAVAHFIQRNLPAFEHQIAIKHTYRVPGRLWIGKDHSYIFRAVASRVLVLWALEIKGYGTDVLRHVPVVLMQSRQNDPDLYDMHVLLPSSPVILQQRVAIEVRGTVQTDIGSAQRVAVLWKAYNVTPPLIPRVELEESEDVEGFDVRLRDED